MRAVSGWGAAAGLAVVGLLVGGAGPARAADEPPGVMPAATGSLRIGTAGTVEAAYLNTSPEERTVLFSVDGAAGVEVSPDTLTIEPGTRATVTLSTRIFLRKGVEGALVANDGERATRWPIAAGPGATAATTAKTWSPTASIGPWRSSTRLDPPRITGMPCPGSEPLTGELWRGTDWAPLTVRCAGRKLVAQVDHLTPFQAGDYTGTLDVGDTEVAVTLRRTAPPIVPVLVMLAGILLAAGLRATTAWRPVVTTENAIAAPPPAPAEPSAWAGWVGDQITATLDETLKTLPGQGSNQGWQRWRWLCAPPKGTGEVVTAARARVAAVTATVEEWTAKAPDLLAPDATDRDLPERLEARFTTLRAGGPAAQSAPETDEGTAGAPRAGIDGVTAVLAEARALRTVAGLMPRIDALFARLQEAAPGGGGSALARAAAATHAQAVLGLTAVQARLNRTEDALALDLVTALREITTLVDRLPPPGAVGDDESWTPQSNRTDRETAFPAFTWKGWPSWPAVLARLAPGRDLAVRLGDTVGLAVAVLVVLAVGLGTLYVGKAWGSWWDVAALLAAALGGTLALAPVFGALDRLGNPADATVSDA